MTENEGVQTVERQAPHPLLRTLDVLVGTWNVSGEAHGQVSFEWMTGGYFLMQRVNLGGSKGVEIIGYDAASNSLKSRYFGNGGEILEYTYEVEDDTLIVSIDMPHAEGDFIGTFNADRSAISGSWEWVENGVAKGYDATLTRAR